MCNDEFENTSSWISFEKNSSQIVRNMKEIEQKKKLPVKTCTVPPDFYGVRTFKKFD